jgi:hypothetical protein
VADTGAGDDRGGGRADEGDQRREKQAGLHGILLDDS